MISINTITSSSNSVNFNEDVNTKLTRQQARLKVTPTLDGSAVFQHFGNSETDRIMKIYARVTETDQEMITTIYNNETEIIMSCREGVFTGYIKAYECDNGNLYLEFQVANDLTS